jgi:hypothetical protein
MEEERNVYKASKAKGKSHALELLGESIDETCARPFKTTVLGEFKDNPHQHWELAHTIGDPPPQLTHIARPPGNPPLDWWDNVSTDNLITRTHATNNVQLTEPAPPQHQQCDTQAGDHMVRKPTRQLPSPTRGIMHTTPEQFNSTARARKVAWAFPVATAAWHPHGCLAATTASKHTHTIEPTALLLVIATTAPPALAWQHTLVAQT